MAELNSKDIRRVYLITYSRADTEWFNRESFAGTVITAFQAVTTALIIQWTCCMEHHMDAGVHFHMCFLLSKLQRWMKIKTYLQEHENIIAFSGHNRYHTAYQYVIKQDIQVLRSENHPALVATPKTLLAAQKRTGKSTSGKRGRAAQKKHLSNIEVSSIIVSNSIDSKLHLFAVAKKRKIDGDSRLYEFVLNKGKKSQWTYTVCMVNRNCAANVGQEVNISYWPLKKGLQWYVCVRKWVVALCQTDSTQQWHWAKHIC